MNIRAQLKIIKRKPIITQETSYKLKMVVKSIYIYIKMSRKLLYII